MFIHQMQIILSQVAKIDFSQAGSALVHQVFLGGRGAKLSQVPNGSFWCAKGLIFIKKENECLGL